MNILVLNGPNLDKLGLRDAQKYGAITLNEINDKIKAEFPEHAFEFFQSNSEGELINQISGSFGKFDGIVLNPGGYAHTSVAIRDAIEISAVPVIEVHLSNLSARENFRQNLITASACKGYISGFKHKSYLAAIYLLNKMRETND